MIAGMLHGVFVIWRSKDSQDDIYDWGIYQEPIKPHPVGYKEDRICEARVPIYATAEGAVEQVDMDRALKVLTETLIHEVQTRSDLARIRQQFGKVKEKGKPKPKVEVMEEHEWQRLMSGGTINLL